MPVSISHRPHSGEKESLCRRWNFDQQKTVVKVKQSSIESRRMKRLMVVYEFSQRTANVTNQTAGLRKFSSFAVK